MNVQCKVLCFSTTKYRSGNKEPEFMYGYKFQAVYANSEENKKFFASTPSLTLEVSAVRDDLFEPGKEYYLNFVPANQP